MKKRGEPLPENQVNPGYALGQIARALVTSEEHHDSETRERARARVEKWVTVLNGVVSGKVKVGSRTPLVDAPAWATLEVVTGGFATGTLLAGGPLRTHEVALLRRLKKEPGEDARRFTNSYYLTERGMAELREMLRTGRYAVSVPEEGALLVVAWLAQNGHPKEARALVDILAPYFSRLRFYPVPAARARAGGKQEVFLQDVRTTVKSLSRIKPNRRVLAQKEAVEVWAPFYDETAALVRETVKGEPPQLVNDPKGRVTAVPKGFGPKCQVEGGVPGTVFPDGWHGRARDFLARFARARKEHALCAKAGRASGNFGRLRSFLEICLNSPKQVRPGDMSGCRLALALHAAKYGPPGSRQLAESRRRQLETVEGPMFHQVAAVLVKRLAEFPEDGGIEDFEAATRQVTKEEAREADVPAGSRVPPSLLRKVERSLVGTVEKLVERGVIPSGDTLAVVLPQLTSELRASSIADPGLRSAYAGVYQAFRRRRSLLLLNLESQVKILELPWVAAIDGFRSETRKAKDLSKRTLADMVRLTLTSFPQAIIPNKLLQEFRALADDAGLDIPLTDEIAADIFMGAFSRKYTEAAWRAAGLLRGSLYARYYDIDYAEVRKLTLPEKAKSGLFRRMAQDELVRLCQSRAGVSAERSFEGSFVARNGMTIEQQQVVTTHNLAALFAALGLAEGRGDHLRLQDLAQRCFVWVCRRLQVKSAKHHAKLIMLKNTAYAWRQMVFFLSLLPPGEVKKFTGWARGHLGKQPVAFQARFGPALKGLEVAASGRTLDDTTAGREDAKRFLGWTRREHWLLAG